MINLITENFLGLCGRAAPGLGAIYHGIGKTVSSSDSLHQRHSGITERPHGRGDVTIDIPDDAKQIVEISW